MKINSLGFIGGGRITRIILQALKNKNFELNSIIVFEPDTENSDKLKKQFPEIQMSVSNRDPAEQSMVFLAIHPPVMMDTIKQIKDVVNEDTIVISLAPKINMAKLSSQLSSKKIVRLIPNATSYLNEGYNPVSFIEGFPEEGKKPVLKMLKKLGKTIEVREEKLEAYAIVSAMLPTYFWFQWKKMEEIAIETGLTENESRNILRSTLIRAIKLYYKSGLSPEEVIDLIPIKPIGEKEKEIEEILYSRLLELYMKITP